MTISGLAEFLLQVGLASAGALWLLSTKLGEGYISRRFDRKLSELEHDQKATIEGLRAQLANVADRGRRANEREFAALTEIWERFVEAFLSTNTCIASPISHPDLTKLTDDETQSFLNSTDLTEEQRKYVLDAKDPNTAYSRTVTLNQINKAGVAIFNVRLALRKKGIFIPSALGAKIQAAIETMSRAQVERSVEFQHRSFQGQASIDFLETGEKMITELGEALRARFAIT